MKQAKNLILFVISMILLEVQLNAQIVTEANLPVSIVSNTVVSANSTWTNNGTIQNDGSIELTTGDWNNTNIYSGTGTIILSDPNSQNFGHNDQEVAILTFTGGDKTITSGVKVTTQLDMPVGLVNTSAGNNLVIGATASIVGFNTTQYINGPLFNEGTGIKTFPIGVGGVFSPTQLIDVQGTNPIVGLEVFDDNINSSTELPLESVSSVRYWQLTELTNNDYAGSQILLPVVNETGLADFDRVAVGEASLADSVFRNLGQSAITGDTTSGTVTSAGLALSDLFAIGSRLAFANSVDSLALVAIYDQTGGSTWNDTTNWKQDFLTTWSGVTLDSDGNVTGLNLAANNVVGDIPNDLANVSGLETLDLSSNEIASIPDLTALDSLTNPDVKDNRLQFGSLESNAVIPGITYVPQKVLFDSVEVLEEINATIVIQRPITGAINQYQWTKDDINIEGATEASLTLPTIQFDAEGTYRVVVTNSSVTLLQLTTSPYKIKISSLERDRLALEAIFNATNGPNWADSSNWFTDDINSWFGVDVNNNRVTALRLPDNNLDGPMPDDLKDVGQLEAVDLRNNSLRQFPDMTRQATVLQSVDVGNNRLGFGDIEPNLGLNEFIYAPQRRYGETLDGRVQVGTDTTISIDISGSNNQYQWFIKPRKTPEDVPGVPIAGATLSDYKIDSASFGNMGIYYVEVSNSVVDDLVIRNRNQNVFVVTDIFGQALAQPEAGVPMTEGDVIVFEIEKPGQAFTPFDTVAVDGSGSYFFDDVVLGDYILLGRPNGVFMGELLQTYYSATNDWVKADTLRLRAVVNGVNINMLRVPPPFDPVISDALIGGTFEADLPDLIDPEAGLRVKARRRVRRAGISLNKLVTRRRQLQEELVLVAYTESDDEGGFSFPSVPPGDYLLNIQFPGIPMDTTTLVKFKIDENIEEQSFNVSALATEFGITVDLIEETGFYRKYFKDLSIYPNPANDYITLDYEKLNSNEMEIRLLDFNGRLIKSAPLESGSLKRFEFDVSDMDDGIYLLVFADVSLEAAPIASYKVMISR